jgi:hypothetical protein
LRLPKKRTASGNVLMLLSLMYFITCVDRVNISTAAPVIEGEWQSPLLAFVLNWPV